MSASSSSSPIILVTAGGYRFLAVLQTALAPKTTSLFLNLLPYTASLIHVRWSGEGVWIPLGYATTDISKLPNENHTSHPAPGEFILYPGGISEGEFLLAYGGVAFSSKMGQLTGNQFLTIVRGNENLSKLGQKTLWDGAQEVRFEIADEAAVAAESNAASLKQTKRKLPANGAASLMFRMAAIVVDLQKRMLGLEEKVRSMEKGSHVNGRLGHAASSRESPEPLHHPAERISLHTSTSGPSLSPAQPSTRPSRYSPVISPSYTSHHRDTAPISPPSQEGQPALSMSTIRLGAPIATLRSLGALPANGSESMLDPIAQGMLSVSDAQRAIKIFFDHCHSFGPVLDKVSVDDGMRLRHQNPPLFLTICTIGARFWDNGTSSDQGPLRERGLHPSFLELTTLLDITISGLILRPTPSDVTLDSIRALLLYAQWMPLSREHLYRATNTSSGGPEDRRAPRSRYNDISAWAVLGLAQRYALFLGLDRLSVLPFQDPLSEAITPTDMARLRIWHNLITCDCNLMLTSGLPASLDPSSAVRVGRTFSENRFAQLPEDKRVTALVELVGITHRAMVGRDWDLGGRPMNLVSLKKINVDFDDWQNIWAHRLRATPYQHNALPFTSVRWYRLSLNSASLGAVLSPSPPPLPHPSAHSPFLEPLEISLTAASQILLALSYAAPTCIWDLSSQKRDSFPAGPFEMDVEAVERLSYAVDYTWISLAFSVVFLVLCRVRGIINDDITITLTEFPIDMPTHPTVHSSSNLYRLVHLAHQVFLGLCQTSPTHPAHDYEPIVSNAAALVIPPLDPENGNTGEGGPAGMENGHGGDQGDLQGLFDLLSSSGMDWPGYLFGGDGSEQGWGGAVDGAGKEGEAYTWT
ncbi:hypothetical protein IAR50_004448 [Cryptococcus sp. DSM 104548]